MSYGAFNDTAEQVLARRYASREQPEVHHGWDEVDAQMAAWQQGRVPRRSLRAQRTANVRAPSKKKRLLALKSQVRVGIRLGRCNEVLAHWKTLASSGLPGAKKAARQLKKTFTNKCMRVPSGKK